jgi:hypothetical protein
MFEPTDQMTPLVSDCPPDRNVIERGVHQIPSDRSPEIGHLATLGRQRLPHRRQRVLNLARFTEKIVGFATEEAMVQNPPHAAGSPPAH